MRCRYYHTVFLFWNSQPIPYFTFYHTFYNLSSIFLRNGVSYGISYTNISTRLSARSQNVGKLSGVHRLSCRFFPHTPRNIHHYALIPTPYASPNACSLDTSRTFPCLSYQYLTKILSFWQVFTF